jgi:Xaa-Pro dipeptidase
MRDLEKTQKAIQGEDLEGWLFYNIHHRDEISDLVLDVPRSRANTRPWACVVFPDRPPLKIVHEIESGILDHVPGPKTVYGTGRGLFQSLLGGLAKGGRLAAQFSTRFPVISFLDHGAALELERGGIRLVPSESLVVRCLGSLDEAGVKSHEKAACALYEIVRSVWYRLTDAVRSGKSPREAEVRDWMTGLLAECGLCSDDAPVLAAGRDSSDPHFAPRGEGELLRSGEVVQFDIWAREKAAGSVYADISWVGVLAEEPSPRYSRVFDAIVAAREAAISLIQERLRAGEGVSGAEVDAAARAKLDGLGYAKCIRHRTGHSIGKKVHGFGVNLDCAEFPDDRPLTEGACFSIEPGLYMDDFGMRTEINAYIWNGRLVVSGNERQARLLSLG